MDKRKATQLEIILKDTVLNGFRVIELINYGKSAAVFKSEHNGELFALKIFDNEIVERFGHEVQIKRIEQEISLKGHAIPNLVKILEGGTTNVAGQEYFYIVMELIDGVNLKQYIDRVEYDEDFVLNVLACLSSTTEHLLNENIVHRDIKPENIMISKAGEVVLMDLGVLKLIGAKSFSDADEKAFVGTLRYAPPEFLLRVEQDSAEGWRAVNLYQIGATLHDLIMKKELFIDKVPYANLVIAIKDDMPVINNLAFNFNLLQLTRDLLGKDWKTRLNLCSKDRISNVSKINDNVVDEDIAEIFKLRTKNQARFDEIEKLSRTRKEVNDKQRKLLDDLSVMVYRCFQNLVTLEICEKVNRSDSFSFKERSQDKLIRNYLFEVRGTLQMGFPKSLFILTRIVSAQGDHAEISLWGIFPSPFLKADINNPTGLFQSLNNELARGGNRYTQQQQISLIDVFKGTVAIDEFFENHIKGQVIKLVAKCLTAAERTVEYEIQMKEDMMKSESRFITRSFPSGSIIIDRL